MRSSALLAALAALTAVVASTGCSYRNEDINRVVDPYHAKAYFNDSDEWYLRSTVVDAPPEHGWISIADGDWLMLEKIRWEITAGDLIGWRTYSAVPGSENEALPGAEEIYRGQPVAIFPITDHFDIQRGFNAQTGEQTNEIVENRDRLWQDREYIRVNWANNKVPTYKSWIGIEEPGYCGGPCIGTGSDTTIQQAAQVPGEPKRWRFEKDYFEVTTRTQVAPDILGLVGYYGPAFAGDRTSAIIDVRHAFMKVPKSDYVALPMPPTVVLEDENGDEVRDEQGLAVRIPINDRFGFFGSLGRNTFDANRGMVTAGQVFNASRFNLWKKNKNADGSEIPLELREPKEDAIVYYGNVEHPKQLIPASQRVAAQWNKSFRDTVFNINKARYSGSLDDDGIPNDVPRMFVFKENDCNVANVERVIADIDSERSDLVDLVTAAAARKVVNNEVVPFDGTIASVRARYDAANNGIENLQGNGLGPNGESFTALQATETQALADLERICSALEYYTQEDFSTGRPAPEGIAPFTYQRLGDTRFSMMNLIVGEFQSGWLGLGPPYADPLTGQTISATANVNIGGLDRSAARAAQYVQIMNGEATELDLLYGYDIAAYNREKLLENSKLTTLRASQNVKDSIAQSFSARAGNNEVLKEMPPGRAAAKFAKIAGTEMEQKLLINEDIALFGGVNPTDAAALGRDEAMLAGASMVRNEALRDLGNEAERRAARMGMRAMDPPEMIDSLLIGQAIAYKDMSYGERFKKLRQDIYVAVQLHEVGHNTGLFHNFAASTDAINYGPAFWELQNLPTDMDAAIAELQGRGDAVSESRVTALENCKDIVSRLAVQNPNLTDFEANNLNTQECLRQSEGMYSSIMDYHGNWNADFNGLGPYDFAATKFAYGQLLEVFPEANLTGITAAGEIKDNIFYNDWRAIPDMFTGNTAAEKVSKMYDREYVKMDWNTSSTRFQPLANEVPYRFGYGAYPEPTVRVFDFGPDTRTNASFQLTRYYEHYFFSHFSRNSLLEYGDAVNNSLGGTARIFDDFNQKMQWFFFYKATDPKFTGSYLEEDFLATTVIGLNHYRHVIAEPNSGDYHTLPRYRLFGLTQLRPFERDTDPLNVALPWSNVSNCEVGSINDSTDFGTTMAAAKTGFQAGNIPLGEGRPFFLGFTDDYVDFYIRYVGHYWAKQYAIIYLADNQAWFPRTDASADFRSFDVGWYRLFPKEVGEIYGNLITQNDIELGGFLDADGKYVRPDIVTADGSDLPDTSGLTRVLPQIAINHNYYAYVLSNIYLNSPTDDVMDFTKTTNIVVDGGQDDTRAFDDAEARDLAAGCVLTDDPADPFDQFDGLTDPPACKSVLAFTHPQTGISYRALKVGDYPVAFELVKRLNLLKERFQRLDACSKDLAAGNPVTDSYCACITNIGYGRDPLDDNDFVTTCAAQTVTVLPGESTTVAKNSAFAGPDVLDVTCTPLDLENRRESAREGLDEYVDYVNDLRTYNQYLSNF